MQRRTLGTFPALALAALTTGLLSDEERAPLGLGAGPEFPEPGPVAEPVTAAIIKSDPRAAGMSRRSRRAVAAKYRRALRKST